MAKKRNENAPNGNILFGVGSETNVKPDSRAKERSVNPAETLTGHKEDESMFSGLGRGERIAAVGVCLLLVVGALGASGFGAKIISTFISSDSSQKTNQSSPVAQNGSMLSTLNPFAAAPVVTGTPLPLSKEYVYAGSRMVAVEDANASALPPADLAVWRPGNGTWYVMNSLNQWTIQQWGQGGTPPDIPVPGDYDGDGKTDFCVFRPGANIYWYIMNSSTGAWYSFQSGLSGDVPAPADYDGDGKTDIAVYRPSIGHWYIVNSSDASVTDQLLGISTDIPTPGDFDGDGKADQAVWRDSNATFYTFRSSDHTVQITQFGLTGDKPVIGDYDGDGKADFAVRRGNDWIIKQSSSAKGTTLTVTWQLGTDTAVQNDYDGDGKVDIAVWRGENGVWSIRNSRDSSTRTVQWGQTGDTPVPAFYRR